MCVHIRQTVREQPDTGYWKWLRPYFADDPGVVMVGGEGGGVCCGLGGGGVWVCGGGGGEMGVLG